MTLMWAGNRQAIRSKGRGHLWHLTPTVLPAERPAGRIPTLCDRLVSDDQVRRDNTSGPTCPRCLELRGQLAEEVVDAARQSLASVPTIRADGIARLKRALDIYDGSPRATR